MPQNTCKKYPDVSIPKANTLKKYGLSQEQWIEILDRQNGVCYICHRLSKTGRLVTDHEHLPKYKKLPDTLRRNAVRGLLCWTCNHYYVGRGITVDRAKNVVSYLQEYQQRKII